VSYIEHFLCSLKFQNYFWNSNVFNIHSSKIRIYHVSALQTCLRNIVRRFTMRQKLLTKTYSEVDFTNMFIRSFYKLRSQKRKKKVKSLVTFCVSEICKRKRCTWNVGEIDPWFMFFTITVPQNIKHFIQNIKWH